MTTLRTIFATALIFGVIFCFSGTGYSQGTNLGTLRGTVTDPNGAVIPNASVKITDQTTGLSRDLTTDGDGNYEAAALKAGTYKITVSASGFKTAEVDAVIKGADVVRADVRTEVGAQSENVLITGAEAGIIEKEQPVIGNTLNNRQLIEIPRDITSIKQRDPDAGRAWREATRKAFLVSLESGFTVQDFLRANEEGGQRCFYLLAR